MSFVLGNSEKSTTTKYLYRIQNAKLYAFSIHSDPVNDLNTRSDFGNMKINQRSLDRWTNAHYKNMYTNSC